MISASSLWFNFIRFVIYVKDRHIKVNLSLEDMNFQDYGKFLLPFDMLFMSVSHDWSSQYRDRISDYFCLRQLLNGKIIILDISSLEVKIIYVTRHMWDLWWSALHFLLSIMNIYICVISASASSWGECQKESLITFKSWRHLFDCLHNLLKYFILNVIK